MFSVYCPAHGTEVLLSMTQMKNVRRSPLGFEIEYRCWCGHEGVSIAGLPRLAPVATGA